MEQQRQPTRTWLSYLLMCGTEECNETGVALSKAFRFGLDSIDPRTGTRNRVNIVHEFDDVIACIELLEEGGWIQRDSSTQARIDKKKRKLRKYYDEDTALIDESKEAVYPLFYRPRGGQ